MDFFIAPLGFAMSRKYLFNADIRLSYPNPVKIKEILNILLVFEKFIYDGLVAHTDPSEIGQKPLKRSNLLISLELMVNMD